MSGNAMSMSSASSHNTDSIQSKHGKNLESRVCQDNNSSDKAFNSNDKDGEINESDTSTGETSPISKLERDQKSSEKSSERKLRKRKINLNDLSSNLTCPKVCHFSNCGIQLPTSSALEWHYEGHFAQELEKLEKLKVKRVTEGTEQDDLVLRRPVRNSAVDRIRLNRQRRLARKTIER